MTAAVRFGRDLFEIENARNLTRDEIVSTFVPTPAFWRLLSAKNHIVLGARGSGKTALAKMLSHDHLARSSEERAKNAIAYGAFIGMYVPTSVEWVGVLKNKAWQTEREQEGFFQWRLNIACCRAFLISLKSCVEVHGGSRGDQARVELELVEQLSREWFEELAECDTIRQLRTRLDDIEHRKQRQLVRLRALGTLRPGEEPAGLSFETPLFSLLRRSISLSAEILKLPEDATWLLCLDEAEFLEPIHQRIINSYLRSDTGNLKFKITTMPYAHHSLETNTTVPLNEGHDFEYVYIDADPIAPQKRGANAQEFANSLFKRRAAASGTKYQGLTLRKLLGPSVLLDAKEQNWERASRARKLLLKYASTVTIARADRLEASPNEFMDQVGRKVIGALLLRDAVESQSGRTELDVYSGAKMIIRCGDGNPRRLIRILNSLLHEVRWREGRKILRIPEQAQNRVLVSFSTSTLTRLQSEPECGPDLLQFLSLIGEYMRSEFYDEPLTTDQVTSVTVEEDVDDFHWSLVTRAVGLGLLFPNVSSRNPDQMPYKSGTFHLAYVLAPRFQLLPRRGRAHRLSQILAHKPKATGVPSQADLFGPVTK